VLDTFTLHLNWGDPLSPDNLQSFFLPAGTTAFSWPHQYLDDNGSGTKSDNYNILVTVTDDDGGTGSASTSVTVENVAPTLTSLNQSDAYVCVGDPLTVNRSFTDLGTLDTHTVKIDWKGDGTWVTVSERTPRPQGT
jgi:hypothetical protein